MTISLEPAVWVDVQVAGQDYRIREEIVLHSARRGLRAVLPKSHGFALVVTLSLMILLTVVAVGLLSLSAVSLRTNSQAQAQAEAQTTMPASHWSSCAAFDHSP